MRPYNFSRKKNERSKGFVTQCFYPKEKYYLIYISINKQSQYPNWVWRREGGRVRLCVVLEGGIITGSKYFNLITDVPRLCALASECVSLTRQDTISQNSLHCVFLVKMGNKGDGRAHGGQREELHSIIQTCCPFSAGSSHWVEATSKPALSIFFLGSFFSFISWVWWQKSLSFCKTPISSRSEAARANMDSSVFSWALTHDLPYFISIFLSPLPAL